MSRATKLPPVLPGEILQEEFLEPFGLSASAFARHIDVPTNRITEIINGDRSISADTAMRFAMAFGTTAEFWMNLQSLYELEAAGNDIGHIKPLKMRAFA